jgi:hypothetical protein
MEVQIHRYNPLKIGDVFIVVGINEDRLDVATMKNIRTAVLEEVEPEEYYKLSFNKQELIHK